MNNCLRARLSLVSGLALSFYFCAASHADDGFRVVTFSNLLPQPNPQTYRDYKMNNSAQIVGNVSSGNHAAIWQNGVVFDLGVPTGASSSFGYGINNSGTVAGQVDNSLGQILIAVYSSSGWSTKDYPAGEHYSNPYSINNSGFLVGAASPSAGSYSQEAIYFTNRADDGKVLPFRPGDSAAVATGVNDSEEIVGVSFSNTNPNYTTAVRWTTNGTGTVTSLGTVGVSSAQAVNNLGNVVGFNGGFAVYWDPSGTSHTLTAGIANAINQSNYIIGTTVQANKPTNSDVWIQSTTSSTAYFLSTHQTSSVTLYTGSDVNDNLQIVGTCTGELGYIATPVLYRSVSGLWNIPADWSWGLLPASVHPVVINNLGTSPVIISAPNTSLTISELTIGQTTNQSTSSLIISNGQNLSVVASAGGMGTTTISSKGTLQIDGQINSPANVQGLLLGSGSLSGLATILSNGIVQPGDGQPGVLTVNGGINFLQGSSLSLQINGPTVGIQASALAITSGTIGLAGPTLNLFGTNSIGFGQTITVIQNNTANTISGTFANLPEGATVTNLLGSGYNGTITYLAGSGNNVAINVQSNNNALLSNLSLSQGILNPSFSSNMFNYTTSLSNSVTALAVTPTGLETLQSLTVNGTPVASGTAANVPLAVGTNVITTIALATDGVTSNVYTIAAFRAAATTSPIVNLISNYMGNVGQVIAFTATVSNVNAGDIVNFVLYNPPTGASITTNGAFDWRPGVSFANSTNVITVIANDITSGLSGTNAFTAFFSALTPILLSNVALTNGDLEFLVSGPCGPDYVVEIFTGLSTNFTSNGWNNLATNLSPNTPFIFTDTNAATLTEQFYRVKLQP